MQYVGFDPGELSRILKSLSYNSVVFFVCCTLTIAAVLIDLWTGIDAARANKEPIYSHNLRRTISKISDYFRVIVFGMLIDVLGLLFPWYILPYCAMLCTLGGMLIEGRSVLENMKRKKSHAADIADAVQKIIQCLDERDAKKIIAELKYKPKSHDD